MGAARLALLALALLVGCAGCSSGHGTSKSASSNPASTAVDASGQYPCLKGRGAVAIKDSALAPVSIVTLGTGPVAVVLSNESDQDLCDWLGFATDLEKAHYRVVLYDYATAALSDLLVIGPYLRAHGVQKIGLIGASVGADGSLQATAEMTPPVDALVTLSAEGRVGDDSKLVKAPVLFVTSKDDPYGSGIAGPVLLRDAPAAHKRLLVVPGTLHGTELLDLKGIQPAVMTFLSTYLPA